jgi:hypothetical protein
MDLERPGCLLDEPERRSILTTGRKEGGYMGVGRKGESQESESGRLQKELGTILYPGHPLDKVVLFGYPEGSQVVVVTCSALQITNNSGYFGHPLVLYASLVDL